MGGDKVREVGGRERERDEGDGGDEGVKVREEEAEGGPRMCETESSRSLSDADRDTFAPELRFPTFVVSLPCPFSPPCPPACTAGVPQALQSTLSSTGLSPPPTPPLPPLASH
ncbi:unnamed protein product [Pleuronectes platessa]|uniref:Uncharacterized protein n=1 Tax=Pleuronectes platessa TaxID=8262 RepID=A0A9N7UHM6_PLEPL|nr:unnamed protein product [Pleuronectes platessa]